jgi:hypothetical protein
MSSAQRPQQALVQIKDADGEYCGASITIPCSHPPGRGAGAVTEPQRVCGNMEAFVWTNIVTWSLLIHSCPFNPSSRAARHQKHGHGSYRTGRPMLPLSGLGFWARLPCQRPAILQQAPHSACHVCITPSAAWFATSLHTRPCHRALSTHPHLRGTLADVSDSHAKGGLAAPFQQCPPVHIIGSKHTEAKARASTWHPPAAVHKYVGMCRSIAPTGRALSTSCQHGNLKTSHVHDFAHRFGVV